jgi:general transcription factor IIIA
VQLLIISDQKGALTVHRSVAHLGQRNFVCHHEDCHRTFGYKHLLQRHVTKVHRTHSDADTEFSDDDSPPSPDTEQQRADISLDINVITGYSYIQAAQSKVTEGQALRCPFPDLHLFDTEVNDSRPSSISSKQISKCDYVFSRAYDLRRHLRASHGFSAQKDSVDYWVAQKKLAWYI